MPYQQIVNPRVFAWSVPMSDLGSGSFAILLQTGHVYGLKASPLTTIQSF